LQWCGSFEWLFPDNARLLGLISEDNTPALGWSSSEYWIQILDLSIAPGEWSLGHGQRRSRCGHRRQFGLESGPWLCKLPSCPICFEDTRNSPHFLFNLANEADDGQPCRFPWFHDESEALESRSYYHELDTLFPNISGELFADNVLHCQVTVDLASVFRKNDDISQISNYRVRNDNGHDLCRCWIS